MVGFELRKRIAAAALMVLLLVSALSVGCSKGIQKETSGVRPEVAVLKQFNDIVLNFGANHAVFEFIAKFDNDDHYGPKYLKDALRIFREAEAGEFQLSCNT